MTNKFSNMLPWSLTKRRGIGTNCRITHLEHLHRIVSTFHIPPGVCFLLHSPPLQHCCCLLSKEDWSLPRDFWDEDTVLISYSYHLALTCSFPTVCRHSVMHTEAEAKMKQKKWTPQNHSKHDHINSLKILPWTQSLFTSTDTNFTREAVKAQLQWW